MFKFTSLFMCVGALGSAFAQTSATLDAAGYSAPAPLQVAPGQVVTLFFHGLGPLPNGQLRSSQTTAVPLPVTLGGLSPRIAQSQSQDVAVPVFAVRQENECDTGEAANPACLLTSVKIEIPFELQAASDAAAPLAQLILDVDGQPSRSFPLQPVPDNAHLVTSCDLSWDTKSTSTCNRSVYHADGTLVTADNPAMRGETVVVYAFGLGKAATSIWTGDVSPAGAALAGSPESHVKAIFGNTANALSYVPRSTFYMDPNAAASPVAAVGLTRGQIGLYQINV